MTPRRPALAADRGSVSLLFVVVAVGLLAMAGLVVDGGGKARAAAGARAYLAAAGVQGTVTVAPGGRRVTVTTTGSYTPVLLSAAGIGPMPVTGSATADLIDPEGGTP